MLYLTTTPTIVEALEKIQSLERRTIEKDKSEVEKRTEPSSSNIKIGNPISHGQLIHLSKQLKARKLSPNSLDKLLRGSRVYIPPPPPKPEPVRTVHAHRAFTTKHFLQTSEYRDLMARLRREEEARSYNRMTNPPLPMETFAQRFPMSSAAHAFPSYQDPDPEDDVTYADINRQMALIANVLLSILACAGAIWVAARWWSTPARLALSMSGSLLVGVAEIVVYGAYIRRVGEAKGKERGLEEIKEVVRTWVIGGEEAENKEESVLVHGEKDPDEIKARRRKKEKD